MSTTQFEEQVDIPARTVTEGFDYVSDFSRAVDWRTEGGESSIEPPAPMRIGTRLREVAFVAGRRVVPDSVVDQFSPPEAWTLPTRAARSRCPVASRSSPPVAVSG